MGRRVSSSRRSPLRRRPRKSHARRAPSSPLVRTGANPGWECGALRREGGTDAASSVRMGRRAARRTSQRCADPPERGGEKENARREPGAPRPTASVRTGSTVLLVTRVGCAPSRPGGAPGRALPCAPPTLLLNAPRSPLAEHSATPCYPRARQDAFPHDLRVPLGEGHGKDPEGWGKYVSGAMPATSTSSCRSETSPKHAALPVSPRDGPPGPPP